MAVREFNGSSDYIHLGGTGIALGAVSQAFSLLALIKPLAIQTNGTYMSCARTTNVDALAEMYDQDTTAGALSHYNYLDGSSGYAINVTAADWQVLGVTRAAADNVYPRIHQCFLSGQSGVEHADGTVSIGNQPSDAWTITQFGRRGTGTNYKNLRVAVAAVFNYVLTDANYETVRNTKTTAAIAALNPIALWDFNQAAVTTAIEDLIGSADQIARSGTTAVADDPEGWTFGLGVALDTVLPDADITTTGWTTAPLYSKLNDESDSTVIQATAS